MYLTIRPYSIVKILPAMRGTQVRSLGWEDSLEKGMAAHSSILVWRTPWTEEPGRLQSMRLQRVGHDWATKQIHIHTSESLSISSFDTASQVIWSPCSEIHGTLRPKPKHSVWASRFVQREWGAQIQCPCTSHAASSPKMIVPSLVTSTTTCVGNFQSSYFRFKLM